MVPFHSKKHWQNLENHWISSFYVPATILTNQYTPFNSKLLNETTGLLGTRRLRTAHFHLQTKEMVDWLHCTPNKSLRAPMDLQLGSLSTARTIIHPFYGQGGYMRFSGRNEFWHHIVTARRLLMSLLQKRNLCVPTQNQTIPIICNPTKTHPIRDESAEISRRQTNCLWPCHDLAEWDTLTLVRLPASSTQHSCLQYPRTKTLGASPSLQSGFPMRPTYTNLYMSPCSPKPYPSKVPVTRTHASRRVHWPDEQLPFGWPWRLMQLFSTARPPPVWMWDYAAHDCSRAMHASIARPNRCETICSIIEQSSIAHCNQ